MWDRGLHSYAMVHATVAKGCDYLGRIPANVKFLAEKPLEDGSYLSWIYPSLKLRKKGCQPILVRVIEYTIEHPDNPIEQLTYRLITSLLDIDQFPAELLVGLRQKLSPNKAQTGFISSKHVTVEGQPIEKSIRHSRSKC